MVVGAKDRSSRLESSADAAGSVCERSMRPWYSRIGARAQDEQLKDRIMGMADGTTTQADRAVRHYGAEERT